jgi:hypothetical protein
MVNSKLLQWLKDKEGKSFGSPRKEIFGRKTRDFEIISVTQDRVNIKFEGKYALPLLFSMFDRTLDYLSSNGDKPIWLGAKVNPPYEPNTLEETIWKKPYLGNYTNSYKVGPHICDILVLAGLAKYVKMINPLTDRKVQGAQIL